MCTRAHLHFSVTVMSDESTHRIVASLRKEGYHPIFRNDGHVDVCGSIGIDDLNRHSTSSSCNLSVTSFIVTPALPRDPFLAAVLWVLTKLFLGLSLMVFGAIALPWLSYLLSFLENAAEQARQQAMGTSQTP